MSILNATISRRRFTAGATATAAMLAAPLRSFAAGSNFKIGVISDEISDDFDHACHVIANDFGLKFVELRTVWHTNMMKVTDAQIAEAKKIIAKYGLTVTDISSPLYKVDFPGAPHSQYGSKEDLHGAAETTFTQQDEILERSISLAKQFGTNKVRIFDFWRLDDVKPYRAAINDILQKAAEKAAKHDILLVLENEYECNRPPAAKPPPRWQRCPRATSRSTGTPATPSCAASLTPSPTAGTCCPKTASTTAT